MPWTTEQKIFIVEAYFRQKSIHAAVPDFLDNVWFSDETHFLLSGHVNSKNNIFCGSTPSEHCLQRPLHSVKCTAWVAISKHGIIGPFWFEDDNEWSVTINTRTSESEGFSTWGVGVVENFNDSDSGQTVCSPIVTVCATNVRKRHTWQFKQLDASTRGDHGYSDRRQRTNFHTFTLGPFQISSVPWAHHATYTVNATVRGLYHWNFHLLILAGIIVAPWRWLRNSEREFSWELVHCYVTHVTKQW